jgi:DNA-binding NarL/FixJ family response regulator
MSGDAVNARSSADEQPTVLVVDDDDGFRAFACEILRIAGYAVLEAGSAEHAATIAVSHAPALVLLDVRLPGMSGYELCRELKQHFRDRMAIIFVSGERTDSSDRVAGLLLGADDYLVKPTAPDELLVRVRAQLRHVQTAKRTDHRLTAREREVLELLTEGLREPEIARRLGITPKTVGAHVEHILQKLKVRSRTEAVAYAFRTHLVGPNSSPSD